VTEVGQEEPLVVFGPRSLAYDFGPQHPLSPRRFGPGIDLLRELGASRFLEPEGAPDEALARLHDPAYVEAVRRLSIQPDQAPQFGFDRWGDNPPFCGMHEAAAAVAGGSLAAMEQILEGRTRRAFHPGGGLHHAMRSRASGFCIYNDVALAVARARDAGHRVLYVDIDVHHGDGVQALFWNDPQVLTVSLHETGEVLFPGTGFASEIGGPTAAGTAVNVPLQPGTGDRSWLAALQTIVPALAEAFRPTMLVTQQGCDTHVWDPLAHLCVTTAGQAAAAALLDAVANRHTGDRWLVTGGGGYDAFRVVPRAWAIAWLTLTKEPIPQEVPSAWRKRWEEKARLAGSGPLPTAFLDDPSIAPPEDPKLAARNGEVAREALQASLRYLSSRSA
jgi:acetoin utilization protein AcuC